MIARAGARYQIVTPAKQTGFRDNCRLCYVSFRALHPPHLFHLLGPLIPGPASLPDIGIIATGLHLSLPYHNAHSDFLLPLLASSLNEPITLECSSTKCVQIDDVKGELKFLLHDKRRLDEIGRSCCLSSCPMGHASHMRSPGNCIRRQDLASCLGG